MDNVQRELMKLDDVWQQTEANVNIVIPDDTYQAQVKSTQIYSSSIGSLNLEIKMEISKGNYKGCVLRYARPLNQTKMFGWIKADFKKMGIELPLLSDIEKKAEELIGACLVVNWVTKKQEQGKEFKNLYIESRIDEPIKKTDDFPF